MPFTISHASIVIPLNRKPFILSALIIGSFSPDFSYFITGLPFANISHSISGIFLFSLPFGIIFYLIFHFFIVKAFLTILTSDLKNSFLLIHSYPSLNIKNIFWVIVSILTGITSHLIWDSFTHKTGPAVLHFNFLTYPLFDFFDETIFTYKLLQYLSTIIGGFIFALWAFRKIVSTEISLLMLNYLKKYILFFIFLIVISGFAGIIYGSSWLENSGFKAFVVKTVVGSVSVFSLLILLLATYLNLKSSIKFKK